MVVGCPSQTALDTFTATVNNINDAAADVSGLHSQIGTINTDVATLDTAKANKTAVRLERH